MHVTGASCGHHVNVCSPGLYHDVDVNDVDDHHDDHDIDE